MEIDLENNDFIEIYKRVNPTYLQQKTSQNMAYSELIVIFDAFAKKNEHKIGFENKEEISTVVPLLSLYIEKMTYTQGTKKIITVALLSLSIIWLMWCTTKQPKPQQQTATNTNTTTDTSCKDAIAAYLKTTKTSTDGEVVAKWNTVTVDYVGRLDEQTVFDTSVESVAKACGKYSTGRNYNEGLAFNVGAGQMIAGFDKGVEGMKVGETKTVTIPAKEAYGERSEKNIIKVPREQIPNADQLQKGMKLMASNGQGFTVYAIGDKEITLDANHELAGKTLIFDITVKSVKK